MDKDKDNPAPQAEESDGPPTARCPVQELADYSEVSAKDLKPPVKE